MMNSIDDRHYSSPFLLQFGEPIDDDSQGVGQSPSTHSRDSIKLSETKQTRVHQETTDDE